MFRHSFNFGIVGVAYEGKATTFKLLVQFIKVNIRQYG